MILRTICGELFSCCHAQHGSDLQKQLNETNSHILAAIELESDWGTAAAVDQNRSILTEELGSFRRLLELQTAAQNNFVVVPDTNALLKDANPSHYSRVVDCSRFHFIIVPTVLSELDGLKRARATQPVGEKAEKAIRTIKGLPNQGSILDDVTVAKAITVQMIPTEPRMADLPSWLDPDNQDDRIIGSVMELQCKDPSATVVLVTDDMNLQNKAEMALLSWAEPPAVLGIAAQNLPAVR